LDLVETGEAFRALCASKLVSLCFCIPAIAPITNLAFTQVGTLSVLATTMFRVAIICTSEALVNVGANSVCNIRACLVHFVANWTFCALAANLTRTIPITLASAGVQGRIEGACGS
jgi:hypothetical protein